MFLLRQKLRLISNGETSWNPQFENSIRLYYVYGVITISDDECFYGITNSLSLVLISTTPRSMIIYSSEMFT